MSRIAPNRGFDEPCLYEYETDPMVQMLIFFRASIDLLLSMDG